MDQQAGKGREKKIFEIFREGYMLPSRFQTTKRRPAGSNFAEQAMLQKSTDIQAYWRLNSLPSGKAEELVSSSNLNGTFSSGNFRMADRSPAGLSCPRADGSATTVDLYSTGLNTAMSWDDFSVQVWYRVGAFSDWQTASKQQILYIAADANNAIDISKSATPDQIDFVYSGQSTVDTVSGSTLVAGASPTTWVHLVVTVSDSAGDDEMKGYIDGVQVSTTQSTLGVFSGAIDADLCLLMSSALGTPADQLASGSLVSDVCLWNTVLTADEVKTLHNLR